MALTHSKHTRKAYACFFYVDERIFFHYFKKYVIESIAQSLIMKLFSIVYLKRFNSLQLRYPGNYEPK